MKQIEYMEFVANKNYDLFYKQGYATAGNNGPHGHIDTPVRNTAHFLIIYTYLYKKYHKKKYELICKMFKKYLINQQKKSISGAIKCMESDRFDHLNGLIGQAWVIEALLYYYDFFCDKEALKCAISIFYSQKYNFKNHLWHRIEINGEDIGIDYTYNHNIWFAACSSKILEYVTDPKIQKIINDFLTNSPKRDFKIYPNGLLHHSVGVRQKGFIIRKIKNTIKDSLFFLRKIDIKKFDSKYMEKAYQVFDMYGFCILEERFPNLDLFKSQKYKKAKSYALNYEYLNKCYHVNDYINNRTNGFNVFSYSYNSLAFEYPYVSLFYKKNEPDIYKKLFKIQEKLMYSSEDKNFTKNNPDIYTFEARSYEIIRYIELLEYKKGETHEK